MKSFFNKKWVKILPALIGILALILVISGYMMDFNHIRTRMMMDDDDTHVAAVGDSITYGLHISNRTENNYPGQLNDMLGEGYYVLNFGVSNHTAQASGDYPYVETQAYQTSLEINPDIVLLMIGTNDSKSQNWNGTDQFKREYENLVESYQSLENNPRIILASPPRVYQENVYEGAMNPENIEEMREIVAQVAGEKDLEFVDMYGVTDSNPEWFPDGIHPDIQGSAMIASAFYEQIGDRN